MINFEEATRFIQLRESVIWATREALKEDDHHKSSEAACSIIFSLPDMFESDQRPTWSIQVYSYILGIGNETWSAKSLTVALALAENEIERELEPYKMKEFERFRRSGKVDGKNNDEIDF